MQGRIGKICMDRENLESGIWKRILEVWNLDIGIPGLSAVIVASRLDLGLEEARIQVQRLWLRTFGLELGIGRSGARRGREAKPTRSGQSKALLLEEEGGHEEERSPQGAAGQRRRFGKRKGDLIERI